MCIYIYTGWILVAVYWTVYLICTSITSILQVRHSECQFSFTRPFSGMFCTPRGWVSWKGGERETAISRALNRVFTHGGAFYWMGNICWFCCGNEGSSLISEDVCFFKAVVWRAIEASLFDSPFAVHEIWKYHIHPATDTAWPWRHPYSRLNW